MLLGRNKLHIPTPEEALPGRDEVMPVPVRHRVLGTSLLPPYPEGAEPIILAMGCFWGPEKLFWETEGVHTTAVGYAGGHTPNPLYDEVCSGATGHTEALLVVYQPAVVSFDRILQLFWENHDPTQGMRQGNDFGTQYRSAIYWVTEAQRDAAEASRVAYQKRLIVSGHGLITTEIEPSRGFYFAEPFHQQYLDWNPGGYCNMGGTGVGCPVGLTTIDVDED